MKMEFGIVAMGLLVGFLVGLTGVGGAALLVPILLIIGISPAIAVGTDLIYNSVTKLFGTIQHWKQKTINFKLVRYFALGSVPGAVIAVVLIHYFDTIYKNQDEIIKHALGYMLILVALLTLYRTFVVKESEINKWKDKSFNNKKLITIVIGFCLGFIVGMTSVGSGSLFALAMMYLYRLSPSELVGTDIAHALLLVTVAGSLHASFGNVDYLLVINLLSGSIPGVIFGSKLSVKLPAKPLKIILSVLILASGVKMI